MEHGMEWNKVGNVMKQFLEYGKEYGMRTGMWNGTEVGWHPECDCVISCSYSLISGAEWNYERHRMKHYCFKFY